MIQLWFVVVVKFVFKLVVYNVYRDVFVVDMINS